MALYARGLYEDSVSALLAAADLTPVDPRCYQFLARAYDSSPKQADDVIQRFRRYAELKPADALAQYYYAMSLWKGKRLEDSSPDLPLVESLLKKSIALDGTLADSHLQLGNLYSDQHNYGDSIPEYRRALELNPNLPDAHYRLGTALVHQRQKDQAQQEFAIYQKLRAQHMAEDDKERAEVQQFIYSVKGVPSTKP
jgi:tetratricopeptide (TPR) repeat protein